MDHAAAVALDPWMSLVVPLVLFRIQREFDGCFKGPKS